LRRSSAAARRIFFQTRAILLARRLGMSRQDFRLGSVMRAPIANVRQA